MARDGLDINHHARHTCPARAVQILRQALGRTQALEIRRGITPQEKRLGFIGFSTGGCGDPRSRSDVACERDGTRKDNGSQKEAP